MSIKIYNIFFILIFFSEDHKLKKKNLMINLSTLRLSEYVNWVKTYELGIKLKLIQENKENVYLTNDGESFFLMNTSNDKLNNEQKNLVFKKCILGNKNFSNINDYLDLFALNENEDFELFKTEIKLQKINLTLEERLILYQLDIIKTQDQKVLSNQKYAEKFAQKSIFNSNDMTESELDEILKEQKEIGVKAEDLTEKFEKNEFLKKNWKYQAEKVKIISKKHVKAGFDVSSFLTKNSKLNDLGYGDKHIEVKGRKWKEFSFIISANELRVGNLTTKKKNEEYFIYFWNNLGSKNPPTEPTRIIPFKNLKIKPCENCLKYLVRLN